MDWKTILLIVGIGGLAVAIPTIIVPYLSGGISSEQASLANIKDNFWFPFVDKIGRFFGVIVSPTEQEWGVLGEAIKNNPVPTNRDEIVKKYIALGYTMEQINKALAENPHLLTMIKPNDTSAY